MARKLTRQEWQAEARQRFGDDPKTWSFVCPVCGHNATIADWQKAGVHQGAFAYSCVGRFIGGCDAFDKKNTPGPCNYAGGGLFRLNPVQVTDDDGRVIELFEFSDA